MEVAIPKKLNKKISVTGEITAKFYDQTTLNPFEKAYNAILRRLANKYGRGLLKYYKLGSIKRIDRKKNTVCNAGLEAICKRLASDNTYSGNIDYCALGTGTPVTPSTSDTTLDTEDYRNAVASGAGSENVAYITAYYTESEVTGTFYEFGNFIDGSAAADSGQLWSHIAGHEWVKDGTTVLVVDCKYTFSNA